ncbi:MAG: nucleotide exchange factor GrpE, partial [Candidatus Woesearchaeota archaeon]
SLESYNFMTKKKETMEQKGETKIDDLQNYKQQVEELTNLVKRVQADFENYRKRMEAEQDRFKQMAAQHVLKDLLTIVDSLELSLNHVHNHQEFQKGIELIKHQLHSLLESYKVKPFQSKGKKFDPKYHEALIAEEAEEDDIVLDEFQKGYLHYDEVLRPAKVKVSKKKKDIENAQTNPPQGSN